VSRYRDLQPDEEARLRALPDFEEFEDAYVDTLTGLVHLSAFEDDASAPEGYRTQRWTRALVGGVR
jgi:hypothetical protein